MPSPDERSCPFCGETIKSAAIKCRFCGEFLDGSGGKRGAQHPARPPVRTLHDGPVSPVVLIGPALASAAIVAITILAMVAVASSRAKAPSPAEGTDVPLLIAGAVTAIALLHFGYRWLAWKRRTFRIGTDRIELAFGVFSRSVRTLDLWRVQDIAYDQNFVEGILGLGNVRIMSTDRDSPSMRVGPVRSARALYDELKQAHVDADRNKGVLHVEQ